MRLHRPIVIIVWALLCLATVPAGATREFVAAGILLIANDGQSALVFLVKHHSRSWYEMPGGRRQSFVGTDDGQGKKRETAYETAIRECYEESRGFLSPNVLRKVTDSSQFIRDGEFVYFLGKIDRFSIASLEATSAPQSDSAAAFREIADYAWVPVEHVLTGDGVSVIDAAGRRIELRHQLKSRLTRARAAGWFEER